MLECKKCGVKINTVVNRCPLCQNKLEEDKTFGDFSSNVFPYIESSKKHGVWQKVMGLIFLGIVLLCTFIDFFFDKMLSWSFFVNFAVVCVGASIAIGVEKKRSLAGILFYEYLFICGATYYWDKITGMHNWALNFVVPILTCVFIIINIALRFVFRRDYLKYFRNVILASVVGILCILFYAKGFATILPPSFISCIMGGVAMLSIFMFDGISVVTEVSRRMHI